MRLWSGQFLYACVASLCLFGRCEVGGFAVVTVLTRALNVAVSRMRETAKPAADTGPLAAPALVLQH
jgi:hypothetical protein